MYIEIYCFLYLFRLSGVEYLNFLENDLPNLLEDVPLLQRQNMYFLHDGAPAHFAIDVRIHLNNHFGQRWIGRGGPHAWPARSPDLNPMDFYLWGHLKSTVYSVPITDEQQLWQRIVEGCNQIRNTPGIFQRIRQSWRRRINMCLEMNGGHMEHLL